MKKKFVKLNNNDNYLSLGNIIRYIKNESSNKILATQTEIFCAIFNIEDANDSTVNNYSVGYRPIGEQYKNIYYNYQKEINKNKIILLPNIINILSIIEGKIINSNTKLEEINQNKKLYNIIINLYNIAKNDKDVSLEFTNKIKNNINNNDLYNAFCSILFYSILEKKQPIYLDNVVKNAIENMINNTNISINDLEKILEVEFMDGINYTYKIKQMARDDNPYALFSLAMMEYNGEITGIPRYNKCYDYLKKAATSGHPRANFMIANLIYNNKIGSKTKEDLELAWNHLNQAIEYGSIAAINTMGLAYLNGYIPNEEKNIERAISLFEEAASYNYTYAYNNLGKIYETNNNIDKAIEYYLLSANLEESWACNKIGKYYLDKKDYKQAFKYFNKGIDSPIKIQCPWNKYNLAKYFYLTGNYEINIEKDINKAISLLKEITIIESYILLFYIAINNNDKENIYLYKEKIENHPNYNNKIKKEIETTLNQYLRNKLNIDVIINKY